MSDLQEIRQDVKHAVLAVQHFVVLMVMLFCLLSAPTPHTWIQWAGQMILAVIAVFAYFMGTGYASRIGRQK